MLEEQRALLPPTVYARLWENVWCCGSGDAFDDSDLAAVLTMSGPIHSPETGWQYVAGLDVGVKHDSTALVIVRRHVGSVERRPSAQPIIGSSVTRAMLDLGMIDAPAPAQDELHSPSWKWSAQSVSGANLEA